EDYRIVALYKSCKEEVVEQAELISDKLGLKLDYQQLPKKPKDIKSYLTSDTVLWIFSRDYFTTKSLLKYVYNLDKPALLVSNEYDTECFNCLKVPVGYLTENKEKTIWINFFQKRNPASHTELIIPKEKDRDLVGMVRDNAVFIERILRASGVKYVSSYKETNFEKTLKNTYETSDKGIICLMRPFRLLSCRIPFNLRLYFRYAKAPALIIPRDENLYTPCH
ncbi:MAG: hypothetical protein LIO65_03500, partial [Odoribacter sp.]|nr:hypothetical protein [Odoribacter sp.]